MAQLDQLADLRLPLGVAKLMEIQPNPLYRFVRQAKRILVGGFPPDYILQLIVAEPVPVLREALCSVVVRQTPVEELKNWKLDGRVLHSNPELMRLLQHPLLAQQAEPVPPEDLICALVTGSARGRPRFSLEVAAEVGGSGGWVIRRAFDIGLDRVNLGEFRVSERELREAVREWSPFEEGGLGTHDSLFNIKLVDQVFLFVSQLQLYFERDLLDEPITRGSGAE
jgi:hypothetical protein